MYNRLEQLRLKPTLKTLGPGGSNWLHKDQAQLWTLWKLETAFLLSSGLANVTGSGRSEWLLLNLVAP